MNLLSYQLRLYYIYRLYAEWGTYIDERVPTLPENQSTFAYSAAVFLLVKAEKKHVFSRFMSVEKVVMIEGLTQLIRQQDDPLSYLDSLYQKQKKEALEKENRLISSISIPHLWQARALLLFVSQPSYSLGVLAAKHMVDALSTAEKIPILNEQLSDQQVQLLQHWVGISYVLMNLIIAGLTSYHYEFTITVSRVLLTDISTLFFLGQQLEKCRKTIYCLSLHYYPTFFSPLSFLLDLCRWDEIGIMEKEPFLNFLLSLLVHVLLSDHKNWLVVAVTYSLLLSTIYLVTKLFDRWFSCLEEDTHAYTDDEINDLLVRYSKHSSDFVCLSAMLGTSARQGNHLIEHIKVFHQRRNSFSANIREKNVLIPINIDHAHWILFHLIYHPDANKPHKFYFFDPLANPFPSCLKSEFETADFPSPEPLVISHGAASCVQQDGFSCGTWIVYVAKLLIEQKNECLAQLSLVNIKKIRVDQMILLYQQEKSYAKPSPLLHILIHFILYTALYSIIFNKLQQQFLGESKESNVLTEAESLKRLGLFANATLADIHRARRKLALQYHPDKNLGNEVEMGKVLVKINEAFDYLIRQNRRS